MTSKQTPKTVLPHLDWSIARLKEAMEKEDTEYYRGAALERFRLTYEVTLKAIHAFAKQEGKIFESDELSFRWAEEKKWLNKKSNWATVIKNYKKLNNQPRKKSTYNTYKEIRSYYVLLHKISKAMNIELSNKD